MTNPIDIVADAIRHPDLIAPRNGHKEADHQWAARVASYALTDQRIVDNAVQALIDEKWNEAYNRNTDQLKREDLEFIARTVLGSVGGGA